ncbi:MAG: Gfo/Idh/MocA family oxidoreductase, partial [Balneolaceae bacterium]
TRRDFIKTSALTAGGLYLGTLPITNSAYAHGNDTIKLALIGCGNRGTGAAFNALNADDGIKLVAMVDVLEDRLEQSYNILSSRFGDSGKVDVPEENQFIGFEKYKEAIALADVVILATPTFFRPLHFEEVVSQGKHVFMEKPLAVDAMGIRRVFEAGKIAKEKNLNVVVGLQRRYQNKYREIYQRIQNGEIGDIISGNIYWNEGPFGTVDRSAGRSELETQIRNQFLFMWTAGGQILDQLIHNIDIANWFIGAHPISAQGMGGRFDEITGPEYGQVYDHNFIEYTYSNGVIVAAQCRRMANTFNQVAEKIVGSEGSTYTHGFGSDGVIRDRNGNIRYDHDGENDANPYQVEFDELIASIRSGGIIDNTERGATSTMTAIMGFMAAYTGQVIHWDDALHSNARFYPHHDMNPEDLVSWDTPAPVMPDENGNYPIPVPGQTQINV